MKKASITEAKNNLSALIDSVKGGSPVLIVDRGRPVARLEPVSALRPDDDSRLARLVREGIVRPARRGAPKDRFATKPPRLKKGVRRPHPPGGATGRAMKFWDASAIVPLLVTEATTKAVQSLAEKDSTMIVWWQPRSNARRRLHVLSGMLHLTTRR